MIPARRRRIFRLTPIRARRLEENLTIAHVADKAGLSMTRVSIVERDPDLATAEELSLLRAAVAELSGSRGGEKPQS